MAGIPRTKRGGKGWGRGKQKNGKKEGRRMKGEGRRKIW